MKYPVRVFLSLGVLAGAMWYTASAFACTPCTSCNNGHNYQDGWLVGPDTGGLCASGSKDTTLIKDPYTVSSSAGSGNWTMIFSTTSSQDLAQVGYAKRYGKPVDNFFEYYTPTTGDVLKFPGNVPEPTVGNYVDYKVDWTSGGGGAFHFFINGTIVDTSSTTSYDGCDAAQDSETHTLADQMPGISTGHEIVNNSEVWTTLGWGTSAWWLTVDQDNTTGADASQYFGNNPTYPVQVETWDKRCT